MVSNKSDEDFSNEEDLVAFLKKGHDGAFRVLIKEYQERLFHIACGIISDREESLDIVQEVFLKVHRNINTFDERSKLSTWLYRITVNECLNLHRSWKRRFRSYHQSIETDESNYLTELGTDDFAPDALYQEKEVENAFQEALKGLRKNARAVFVLKEVEGLSYDEISGILKIKRGTVSSRLCYARKNLRKSLGKYLDKDQS
ncbi:MAG: sigma-70 family RNA polymerase sigma factor [Thermodesulfobacteriota bacterium]|nr:sigma-70 family RNA polymerase sigma factor [Thermodesulfobacteriota bacterium]